MSRSSTLSGADWNYLFLSWLIAAISTMGSIFFSHTMQFPPCVLCWYQRIFLFPLVVVFATGLLSHDQAVVRYGLPLTLAGWLVALYHNLLYVGIIPESIQPCTQGVSCTENYIELFGFLSIPLLSLLSFTSILLLLTILKRRFSR
ncbi:MAG: disulfide bond formation protein B [Proteobacteria bacterium]|nr:disulfide bond formation protein B [Pseudomonadota bacterium]MBU1641614.1 disulfide bond formation protein B [Pseudomonadota bacterium]